MLSLRELSEFHLFTLAVETFRRRAIQTKDVHQGGDYVAPETTACRKGRPGSTCTGGGRMRGNVTTEVR